MNEINIYLDESGKLEDIYNKNDKNCERFFIIGGFVAEKTTSILRHFLRTELKMRKEYGISNKFEIKAAGSNPNITYSILNSIHNDAYIITIIVDKKHINSQQFKDINLAYNYFVGQLLIFIWENKDLNLNKYEHINLFLDSRSQKIQQKYNLKEFLIKEKKITKINRVEYLDSKSHPLIRVSDFIAHFQFKKYNYKNKDVYDRIEKNLNSEILAKLEKCQSKFPFKHFNK